MALFDLLPPLSQLLIYTAVLIPIWKVCTIIYRLFFHPLAHIPGPKLAAITFLYQTYFCFAGGSYFYRQVAELHKRYGPVVRITPDEVSLSDPENYEKIYYVGSAYSKPARFYNAFGAEYAAFSSISNDVHRLRRAPLSKFFSRAMVLELQGIVQEKAEKVCSLITEKSKAGEELDVHHAFRAISVDIITDYGFDRCYNLLHTPDLGKNFFAMVRNIGPAVWILQQWPQLLILNKLPPWMLMKINPSTEPILSLQALAKTHTLQVQADIEMGRVTKNSRRTIFHEMLTPNPEVGYVPPTADQFKFEAYVILGAASDTTGNALSTGTHHVIKNPEIYKKLSDELKAAYPDPHSKLELTVLERLPYLTGVVNEALRLSFGVISRLPRTVPKGGAVFHGYAIPASYSVGMSSWALHHNEEYFPQSYEFIPERWIGTDTKKMRKAFVPFGKDSRMCVGMPLALCEIYVTLGTVFRRFDHLVGNHLSEYDLSYEDFFAGQHPVDAVKLHVKDSSIKV